MGALQIGEVREKEENKKSFVFFVLSVQGADMNTLNSISPYHLQMLDELNLREDMFIFPFSKSVTYRSDPEDKILLPPPNWII